MKMTPVTYRIVGIIILLFAFALINCSHQPLRLTPTGWEILGEPYDSLTRALEIGMSFDMPDDSAVLLCQRFADAALNEEDNTRAVRRAHYWMGRASRRSGDEATAQKEFRAALSGPPTSETDYLSRRIAWLNEDPDSLSRNQRYHYYLDEIEYYSKREDAVMLFSRYVDLFKLMRDIGYTARQMDYLYKSDSCMNVIGKWRHVIGPFFNTACTLIDLGDTVGAKMICIELARDPKVNADPDLRALAKYNLYVVTKDTAALGDAYRTMKKNGDDPFSLFPIVCSHLAEEALNAGDPDRASGYVAEVDSISGVLGQSGNMLVTLRTKARVKEATGTPAEASAALREYAEAADSLQAQQTREEVMDSETLAEIKKYEKALAEKDKIYRTTLWTVILLTIGAATLVSVIMTRKISGQRKRRKEAEKLKDEALRRELAIRIRAEKQGQNVEELETFKDLFSKIRPEFIDALRKRCPRIGNSSIRVACYIVMGLDSKEIADTMNVRPESVKQTRWRLRKALGVPQDANLQTYLTDLNDIRE